MKQILFVDDKPAIGKVLSVDLGKENELVYFEDPVRAIEWLNEGNEPALIISDIRMPKMTGSEFLAYLKGNSLFKDIPVVMLSSEESTTERINLLEAGAEDFILKPFNPMELKARIKKFLYTTKSMDMLYYIYIGSNRTTIDHLSNVTGVMFMAVSSCNKATKVIDGIR